MRELVYEVLLRLPKPIVATVFGLLFGVVALGLLGAQPSPELALLCWLSGAAFVLLVQEGPI